MSYKRCKEICKKDLRFVAYTGRGISYENGYRRCSTCEKSIKTDELLCPCCQTRLRFKMSAL